MKIIRKIIEKHCYITQDGVEDIHCSIEDVIDAMKEYSEQIIDRCTEIKEIEEIRTTYIDENNYCHVDIYFKDIEEGKTVAVIDLDNKKVFWIDTLYYSNKRINSVIKNRILEIPDTVTPIINKLTGLIHKIYSVEEADHSLIEDVILETINYLKNE